MKAWVHATTAFKEARTAVHSCMDTLQDAYPSLVLREMEKLLARGDVIHVTIPQFAFVRIKVCFALF